MTKERDISKYTEEEVEVGAGDNNPSTKDQTVENEQVTTEILLVRYLDRPHDEIALVTGREREIILDYAKLKVQEIQDNIKQIEAEKSQAASKKKHGRTKRTSQINLDRKNKQKQIDRYNTSLNILTGNETGIFIIASESDKKIVDVKPLTASEHGWWKIVRNDDSLYHLYKSDPERFNLLMKAFTLRYNSLLDPIYSDEFFEFTMQHAGDEDVGTYILKAVHILNS